MIVKKYTYEVLDKNGNIVLVSARIEKENGYYCWYTSHLTKPQDLEKIGIYIPSNTESSLMEAEAFLKSYINTMRHSKVVVPNEYY